MHKTLNFYFLLLALSAVCLGCTKRSDVAQIVDHPRKFIGETVRVEGRVVDTFSLLVIHYFVLRDDTGTISVVTEHPLPARMEKIEVTGEVIELSIGQTRIIGIKED